MLIVLPWVRLACGVLLSLSIFYLLREQRVNARYQHSVRMGLMLLLTLATCPWGSPLLPGFIVFTLAGYLVLDPTTEDDTPMPAAPTKWRKFWQVLTGRRERLAIWSAYVEAVILLLALALYAYSLPNG